MYFRRFFLGIVLIPLVVIFTSCNLYEYNVVSIEEETEADFLTNFEEEIHSSLSPFILKLYGNKEKVFTTINRIVIQGTMDTKFTQEILVGEYESRGSSSDKEYGMHMEDVNFDGYKDIMLQVYGGSGPNMSYTFWLWDKDLHKFIKSEELSILISPEIDRENEIIKSTYSSSAGAYYVESFYRYLNGRLTLVKEIERIVEVDIKHFCYTVKELSDKQMVVVDKYTEPYQE